MTKQISEARKAQLIEQYHDINVDYEWWDTLYDEFVHICEILGIEIDTRAHRTMGGGVVHRPRIHFSGFCSQGDGASWSGCYRATVWEAGWKHKVSTYDEAPAKIREYAPKDEELHRIADELCFLARVYYPAYARVGSNSQYCHSGTMILSAFEPMEEDADDYAEEVHEHVETTLTDLFRDLADWLYAQLEKEYDYLTGDEAVWDAIQANELDQFEDEEEEAA